MQEAMQHQPAHPCRKKPLKGSLSGTGGSFESSQVRAIIS